MMHDCEWLMTMDMASSLPGASSCLHSPPGPDWFHLIFLNLFCPGCSFHWFSWWRWFFVLFTAVRIHLLLLTPHTGQGWVKIHEHTSQSVNTEVNDNKFLLVLWSCCWLSELLVLVLLCYTASLCKTICSAMNTKLLEHKSRTNVRLWHRPCIQGLSTKCNSEWKQKSPQSCIFRSHRKNVCRLWINIYSGILQYRKKALVFLHRSIYIVLTYKCVFCAVANPKCPISILYSMFVLEGTLKVRNTQQRGRWRETLRCFT